MSAIILAIGLAVAGQLGAADDRYPSNEVTSAADAAAASDGDAVGTDLVPFLDEPPASSAADSDAPQGVFDGDTEQSFPFGESASPPAAADLAPPPTGEPPPQADSFVDSSVPVQPATELKPSAMMRAMLTAPRASQLTGQPVPLIDVLEGAAPRLEQAQRIDAYWDLCASVADYYLGLREREDLRSLRNMVPANQRAASSPTPWEQAESELTGRLDTAQRAALASQWRLAGWLGRGPGNLPLPADVPHCGDYHSRYEEIFANRLSAEAEQLAALLPLRYAELKDAAAAVARAEEWLDAVATVRNEASDGTGAVRALELLALRRRAFAQIARDYNRRIARYCELAAPGDIDSERLISMLIKTEHTASTATRSASPPPPGQQSSHPAAAPPPTFSGGEGWMPAGQHRPAAGLRDEAIQPTSGEAQRVPRQERSMLVAPR